MISFYVDDLTELLLEEFLGETVVELQKIEEKSADKLVQDDAKLYAENLLKNLVDYQSEESLVQMRWTNPS